MPGPITSSSDIVGPEPPGPPLLGALLRMLVEAVRERVVRRLREGGFDGLDAAHTVVLQYPGPDGWRPTDLAVRLGMSKQALNHLLGQMERLGYLERRPDPEDRRSRRIALTQRGRGAFLAIRRAVAEVEAEWAARIGPERLAELRQILVELNRPG
jgi:DNA-binding MarR family transcriptional regulator